MSNLHELKNEHRGDFLSYKHFKDLDDQVPFVPLMSKQITEAKDHGSIYELKQSLKGSLDLRPDSKEIRGLSALQVGLPVRAVYLEYTSGETEKSIILTDPDIELILEVDNPRYFLKLVKCPTSPSPYHIGMFTKDIQIISSNNPTFTLTDSNLDLDPTFNFSAKLQQVIWANKGVLPGDGSGILLNYLKTCKFLEDDDGYKDVFNCSIHRSDILDVISATELFGFWGEPLFHLKNLRKNFIDLYTASNEEEWITIPPVNMLRPLDTADGGSWGNWLA